MLHRTEGVDHVPRTAPAGTALVRVLTAGTPSNRLLRFGLAVIAASMTLIALRNLLLLYPWAADVVIPFRAGQRWLAGQPVYLPASFLVGPGYDLPFLYPPPVLPVLAALALLPAAPVIAGWMAAGVLAAVFAARRLAVPTRFIPLLLMWPPFAEALLGGNVQLALFAAFCALFFPPQVLRGAPPRQRDLVSDHRAMHVPGLQALAVMSLKVTQAHAFVYLARRRPWAALAGGLIGLAITLVTLAATGLGPWLSWFEQLSRASDPAWPLYGASFLRPLPREATMLIVGTLIVAAAFVPNRHAAAWLGILMVVGSPSLRIFGLLFLLPAMAIVRREIALVAALLVATYTFEGLWLAVGIVAAALAGASRLPSLLEPPNTG